jgi:uncharacterized protein YjeT (DUF2065 family)
MSSTKLDMRSYTVSKLSMLILGSFVYIVGGIGFCFFPHQILTLINLKTTDNVYIRMFGLLTIILGVNYYFMVQQTAIVFFKLSIIMRYLTTLFMIYLANTGISSNCNLLVLAFAEAAAATWTLLALWYDYRASVNNRQQLKNYYGNECFYIKFVY